MLHLFLKNKVLRYEIAVLFKKNNAKNFNKNIPPTPWPVYIYSILEVSHTYFLKEFFIQGANKIIDRFL